MKKPRGRPRIDLTGLRFGRLVCIRRTDRLSRPGVWYWLCRCDCGSEKEADSATLKAGSVKSCGCLYRESRRKCGFKSARGLFGCTSSPERIMDAAYRKSWDEDMPDGSGS